ncbi:hypothetical protein OJF2_61740 [Aquisphaera giovannonii]|uniref:DUF1772 domain-containing protein n=1 Tax=Aquisphaera giovannonii TaxID=406548 RepID=A0A5B9WAP5_9BACT|nr:hypothetical protein [Aquisphaera giovannonii]QEH37583.1 hypothetical protein OJF2_61740 [Aquisphaera giovannonii]
MNEIAARILFLAHLASTLFMVGLIWFVQVVHYPLFAHAGRAEYLAYQRRHMDLTTWVVGPPMLVEAATAVLLFWLRPAGIPAWQVWLGLSLVVVLWASTAFVQVPCHDSLLREYAPDVQRRLVSTNWMRTAAWSLRGLLVLAMLWKAMG